MAVLLLPAPSNAARPAPPKPPHFSGPVLRFWDGVARCEEGGNWRFKGSVYSGALGFANSTWSLWAGDLGLTRWYPNAGDAPRLVQIWVADWGYRVKRGYWGSIEPHGRCAGWYPSGR